MYVIRKLAAAAALAATVLLVAPLTRTSVVQAAETTAPAPAATVTAPASAATTVVTAPAGDTTQTTVAVPWGSWLADLAALIAALTAPVLAWLLRFLPSTVQSIVGTMQAEQLLTKAVNYAVNAVAGAERGKVLTVNVGNAVVAKAVQYVVDHGAGWLVSWMGGEAAVTQKIIARLDLEPAAQVNATSAATTSTAAPLSKGAVPPTPAAPAPT